MRLAEVRVVKSGGIERRLRLLRCSTTRFEWEEEEHIPLEAPVLIDGVVARLVSVRRNVGLQSVVAEVSPPLEPMHTRRFAESGFREAFESASAPGYFLFASEAVEADAYWVFPVSEIGVLAIAVDKRRFVATVLGSGHGSLEEALADYEATTSDGFGRASEWFKNLRRGNPE